MPDALYFIESGQAKIQLESKDGKYMRLQTIGMGEMAGELGFYLKRPVADLVIVQEPGIVYRLSLEALRDMQAQDSSLVSFFHEFMAQLLSERLTNTNAKYLDKMNAIFCSYYNVSEICTPGSGPDSRTTAERRHLRRRGATPAAIR